MTDQQEASQLPPIRREIVVDADRVTAFEVFTDRIGRWWPLGEFAVHGAGSGVAFDDGVLVETSADGERSVWGTVTAWQPPDLVAFTWHPGAAAERASQVTVRFTEVGDRTTVRLDHAGWEVFDDPAAVRDDYDRGWPMVLGRFAEAVGVDAPSMPG